MSDDSSRVLPLTVAIGGSMTLFATFLPWYSFEVVLPVGRVVHIFAVTTTLWGFTTLAPILIIAGASAALVLATLLSRPLSNVVIALIGLAIFVYAIVRCFDIPNLGVQVLPGGIQAVTQLEGGPFIELSGGLLLVLGALGDLLAAPVAAGDGSRFPGRWRSRTSVPPPHATA
jgi:hypothetical protein